MTAFRVRPDDTRDYFWAEEVAEPAERFAVLLVLEGTGTIDGSAAAAGDAFVVPAAARELDVTGELRVLRCLAPQP